MSVRVFIVDDHPMIVDGLRSIVTHFGMDMIEANNCHEARALLEHVECDVVLLDIELPDGNGFDLLSQFKKQRPELPVLIHSFHDRRTYIAHSYQMGARGYLVKGLDYRDLLDTIRKACNGESVWAPGQLNQISALRNNDHESGSTRIV